MFDGALLEGYAKLEEVGGEEGEEAGGDVVEHDAGAGGELLELADGRGFEDIEEAEEEEGEGGVAPVWGDGDEGDELSGDLVDDDVAGVFAPGLAGDDGSGGAADEGGGEGGPGAGGGGGGGGVWAAANQRSTAATEP